MSRGGGGEAVIQHPTLRVKSLGIILDDSLSVEAQLTASALLAFYHLQLPRQLVSYLAAWDLATAIHAMVTSRLGY